MTKSRYVRLKDLVELAEKYPNAILAYPVDANKYEFSHKLSGEFYEELVEMHEEFVGKGHPKMRHVIIIK